MYSKVKLSKRQIKEDKFTTFMLSSKYQIQENWQFYAIGALVVILAIVGIVYYFNYSAQQSQVAAERYATAAGEYRSGNSQVAILSFQQILDEFSGDPVAEQATFMLGKVNLEVRNYPEAVRYFEMYLDKYRENRLNRAAAQAGIATAEENQANHVAAAERFQQAVDAYPGGPLAGDYHLGAMRNYLLAGDVESARPHLEKIEQDFAGTPLAQRATRVFYENR